MTKWVLIISMFLLTSAEAHAQGLSAAQYREDFDFFWSTIRDQYAYWDQKQTDWDQVRQLYASRADTVTSRRSFIHLLEKVLNEIYDHHALLSTNTPNSQRLVPTGTDTWAEYINGKPVIVAVRPGFGAARVGITPGMEIIAVNDVPVDSAIRAFYPAALRNPDVHARNYALRALLAGNHVDSRKITVTHLGKVRDLYPDKPENLLETFSYTGDIESTILDDSIGYIRINNCLWKNALIRAFDSVLNTFMQCRGLILDLRETPSGGNTTVARAITGRFIQNEKFYQKHELVSEERAEGVKRSWVEIVSPRAPVYSKPLVILVGRWTGSVGEGIAIGFDALGRAPVIGSRMAGLNGAMYSFRMPNSGIGFSFPVEKLYHVNGTPREEFVPKPAPPSNDADPAMAEALRILRG